MKGLIKVAATVLAVAALSACSSKHSKDAGKKKNQPAAQAQETKATCYETLDFARETFKDISFESEGSKSLAARISNLKLDVEASTGNPYVSGKQGMLDLSFTIDSTEVKSEGSSSKDGIQMSDVQVANNGQLSVTYNYDVNVKALNDDWSKMAAAICFNDDCSVHILAQNAEGQYEVCRITPSVKEYQALVRGDSQGYSASAGIKSPSAQDQIAFPIGRVIDRQERVPNFQHLPVREQGTFAPHVTIEPTATLRPVHGDM